MVSVNYYVFYRKQFLFAIIILFVMEIDAEMTCPNDTYPIGVCTQGVCGFNALCFENTCCTNGRYLKHNGDGQQTTDISPNSGDGDNPGQLNSPVVQKLPIVLSNNSTSRSVDGGNSTSTTKTSTFGSLSTNTQTSQNNQQPSTSQNQANINNQTKTQLTTTTTTTTTTSKNNQQQSLCVNQLVLCDVFRSFCQNPVYKRCMIYHCPMTCGVCNSGGPPSSTSGAQGPTSSWSGPVSGSVSANNNSINGSRMIAPLSNPTTTNVAVTTATTTEMTEDPTVSRRARALHR